MKSIGDLLKGKPLEQLEEEYKTAADVYSETVSRNNGKNFMDFIDVDNENDAKKEMEKKRKALLRKMERVEKSKD